MSAEARAGAFDARCCLLRLHSWLLLLAVTCRQLGRGRRLAFTALWSPFSGRVLRWLRAPLRLCKRRLSLNDLLQALTLVCLLRSLLPSLLLPLQVLLSQLLLLVRYWRLLSASLGHRCTLFEHMGLGRLWLPTLLLVLLQQLLLLEVCLLLRWLRLCLARLILHLLLLLLLLETATC